MDSKKVEAINDWPILPKVKEVQLFLGFANLYRCFINNFFKIAKPLHELTHKNAIWNWMDKYQEAFDKLKVQFVSQPILAMIDTTKLLRVKSDAPNYTTGAVLSMKHDNGKWHPCAYLSKGFNDTECNYDVHNKEMMGIMHALEAWHCNKLCYSPTKGWRKVKRKWQVESCGMHKEQWSTKLNRLENIPQLCLLLIYTLEYPITNLFVYPNKWCNNSAFSDGSIAVASLCWCLVKTHRL